MVADFTVTIAATKRGLLADNATNLVGRLEVVPLSDLPLEAADETVACAASLQGLLPRRPFDAHKNQFGRVGIVAGSRGFAGAATMCAWGALRGGAGLVEVFVPENIYEIVAAARRFRIDGQTGEVVSRFNREKDRCLGNWTRTGSRQCT